MGILKKLGKAVKRVARGVKKVFKKATKFVGRAMASKWGKLLMVAATVFTMGAAAGVWGGMGAAGAASGSAANAGGFFSRFVGGAKGMLGIGQQAAGTAAAAGGATQVGTAGALIPKVAVKAAPSVAGAAGGGAGVMARAGTAALNFLKSPGGATLAGNVISGYAQGEQQQEALEEEERRARYYDGAWRDPAQLSQLHEAASADLNTPMGFMNRARRVTQFLDERAARMPIGPVPSPATVAGFATGG